MECKYIVIASAYGNECPIIFPAFQNHHEMANDKNVISAGFLQIWMDGKIPVASCFGESKTLEIKSRPEEDKALIHQLLRIGEYYEQ